MTDKVQIKRETLEQAIRALENAMPTYWTEGARMKACTDLRAAMKAQPPVPLPEPVERLMRFAGKRRRDVSNPCLTAREAIVIADYMAACVAAQPAVALVPLTVSEIERMWSDAIMNGADGAILFARAVETAHGIGACKYPDCVDNGPDGKCTDWLTGACPGHG